MFFICWPLISCVVLLCCAGAIKGNVVRVRGREPSRCNKERYSRIHSDVGSDVIRVCFVQAKVNEENKDLVQGKARKFNKDRFLGGSDHFVPLHQAKKQLAGEGYGHRYSITDWLSGH